MFAKILRRRNWLAALAVAIGCALVFAAFASDTPSTSRAATAKPGAVSLDPAPPTYGTSIQDQLRDWSYRLVGTESYDSSDAHRTINSETWMIAEGQGPLVFLTDAYPGKPGTYVIDTVFYGPTRGYQNFWCVPPSAKDASNLTIVLSAAITERGDVLSDTLKPVKSSVPGTDVVTGAAVCYMK